MTLSPAPLYNQIPTPHFHIIQDYFSKQKPTIYEIFNIVLFPFCQTHFRPNDPLDAARRQIEIKLMRAVHLKSTAFGFFQSHVSSVHGYLIGHCRKKGRIYSVYGIFDAQYMVIYFNNPQYVLIQRNYV